MDCREVQEKIMFFINEELPEEHMETFLEHVDSCKECKEELEISYSIFWGLKMLQDETADSFHIQQALDKFMTKKREEIRGSQRRKKFLFGLFIGFLIVVFIFFGLQLVRFLRPEWIQFLLSYIII